MSIIEIVLLFFGAVFSASDTANSPVATASPAEVAEADQHFSGFHNRQLTGDLHTSTFRFSDGVKGYGFSIETMPAALR